MNPTKLMAAALCAAACVTTPAFAEDDFGIESASPIVIADPVNPQPGMLFNAYLFDRLIKDEDMKDSPVKLVSAPSVKTCVDKDEKFSLDQLKGLKANVGKWEGFLKCKSA